MTLHTLSSSPFATRALEQCLCVASPGDALLLYADGVYAALQNATGGAGHLDYLPGTIAVYAIEEDCIARGIEEKLRAEVRRCDYRGFVELVAAHDKSLAWF